MAVVAEAGTAVQVRSEQMEGDGQGSSTGQQIGAVQAYRSFSDQTEARQMSEDLVQQTERSALVRLAVIGAGLAVLAASLKLIALLAGAFHVHLLLDAGSNVGNTGLPGAAGAGGAAGGLDGGGPGAGGGAGSAAGGDGGLPVDPNRDVDDKYKDAFDQLSRDQAEWRREHPPPPDPPRDPPPSALDQAQNTFWEAFWTLGGRSPR